MIQIIYSSTCDESLLKESNREQLAQVVCENIDKHMANKKFYFNSPTYTESNLLPKGLVIMSVVVDVVENDVPGESKS